MINKIDVDGLVLTVSLAKNNKEVGYIIFDKGKNKFKYYYFANIKEMGKGLIKIDSIHIKFQNNDFIIYHNETMKVIIKFKCSEMNYNIIADFLNK